MVDLLTMASMPVPRMVFARLIVYKVDKTEKVDSC